VQQKDWIWLLNSHLGTTLFFSMLIFNIVASRLCKLVLGFNFWFQQILSFYLLDESSNYFRCIGSFNVLESKNQEFQFFGKKKLIRKL
jgi:hypothetical protein